MPIRCHADHDGQGIALSRIETAGDAESLCCFFREKVTRVVEISGREGDYRLFMPGVPNEALEMLVASSNIELI